MDAKTEKEALELEEYLPINNNQQHAASSGSTNDGATGSGSYTDPDDEKALLDESHQLTAKQAQRWRQAALGVAWISVIIFLVFGVVSFVLSSTTESSAAFGFGFDCVLDVCTSAVVIWRFYGSIKTLYSEKRERIALLFLAGFFLIASFSIVVRDITELVDQTRTKHGYSLCVLAVVSGTTCTILALCKFVIAKRLESRTVRSDGYSSLAGAVTGFSILISTRVIAGHPNIWYLDNIVGFCVAALLMLYGIMLLVGVLSNSCLQSLSGNCTCCEKSG